MKGVSRSAVMAGWIVFAMILFVIGNWIIFFPLKIFAVFLHEMSHAVATLLTGGKVLEIALNPQEGGHALTQGGWRFLTLSAGYLGNLVLGSLIMLAACRSRWDKEIATSIGVVMFVLTISYVRGFFALSFAMAFSLALIAMGVWGHRILCDMALRLIGFYSAFYAVLDIRSDVLQRSELHSDARMLAELSGIPTIVWGIVWFAISIVVLCVAVWFSSGSDTASKTDATAPAAT